MSALPGVQLFGIEINNVSLGKAIGILDKWLGQPFERYRYVLTPNIDHIVLLQKDKEFRKIYQEADLVLPDSMPLVWISRFLGKPLKARVTGADLFPALCALAARRKYKVFLLGAQEKVAMKAARGLIQKYPSLKITGIYSPPYGFENNPRENQKIVRMILSAKPHILFVALGAPKQEKWIYQYQKESHVPLAIGVGAAFDFLAGDTKRASGWVQLLGLEWFWRLLENPGRLWKRYLLRDPAFFYLVLREKYGKKNKGRS